MDLLQGKGDVILPLAVLGVVMFITSGWPAILHDTIWSLANLNATTTTVTPGTAGSTQPTTTTVKTPTVSTESNPGTWVATTPGSLPTRLS